jgi:hypothetical protein
VGSQLLRFAEAEHQDVVDRRAVRRQNLELFQRLAGEFRNACGTAHDTFRIDLAKPCRLPAGTLEEDRKTAGCARRLCETDVEFGSHDLLRMWALRPVVRPERPPFAPIPCRFCGAWQDAPACLQNVSHACSR